MGPPKPRSLGLGKLNASKQLLLDGNSLSPDELRVRMHVVSRFERLVNPLPVVPRRVVNLECDTCNQSEEEAEYEEIPEV